LSRFSSHLPTNKAGFDVLLTILAFLLPITKRGVPLVIAAMAILRLWQLFTKDQALRVASIPTRRLAAAMAAYFLLHLIGMLWTEDIATGWKEIEYKLSFAIFPLLLGWRISRDEKLPAKVCLAFIAGCIVFIIWTLLNASWKYSQGEGAGVWFYSELSMHFHPSYSAMYISFAMVLWISLNHKLKLWWHIMAAALMLVYIGLLSSKAGMVSAGFAICAGSVLLWQYGQRRHALIFIGATVPLLAINALFSPGVSARIESAINDSSKLLAPATEHVEENTSSTNLRRTALLAGIRTFAQHPLGTGTGDLNEALKEEYIRQGAFFAAEKKLNPHNQILSTGIALGWPGILALLALFWFGVRFAWKNSDYIYLSFLLIVAMNLMVESMLEMQGGIVFFCYWMLILVESGKITFPRTKK
jgi:hypothetical protein